MPILHSSGVIRPGQLGPIRRDFGCRCASARLGLFYGREDRESAIFALPICSALLGMGSGHHFGSVIGKSLFGVKSSGFPGQALNDDFGVFVD